MREQDKGSLLYKGKLNTLSLAVASVLALIGSHDVLAQTTIAADQTSIYNWAAGDGDLTVANGVSVSVSGSGGNIGILTDTISLPTGTLTNLGTIYGDHLAFSNAGSIAGVVNDGLLQSANAALYNNTGASIGTISNNGSMIGGLYGMINNGNIDTLSNNSTGLIKGDISGFALLNSGTIGTLSNAGTISNAWTAVFNSGTIGTLVNSGLISSGTTAITNNGTLTSIANSGVVQGNVRNNTARDLTISGGAGSIFGTLTGVNGRVGTITNTLSNLVFAGGNQLLDDHINVATNTVSNTGTSVLQVNNHISITGNYSQGANATLAIGVADGATSNGVAADTGYGYLVVSGNTTLAAGSTIALKKLNSYAFAQGQRYVVIITAGTANYTTSSLNYSLSGFNVSGDNVTDGSGNTNLVLTLSAIAGSSGGGSGSSGGSGGSSGDSSSSPISYATTSNGKSSLGGLFNYGGVDTSLLNVFNAAAALGSTDAANRAGAQLAPAANTVAATHSVADSTNKVIEVVASHVDGLRLAQRSGGNGSGIATGEEDRGWAAWGQGFGGSAQQSQRDNVSGYRASYSGLVLGADRKLDARWRVGALASYASNSVNGRDDNAGSSSHINSYGLMGYAGYTADQWYVDMTAGALRHKYDTSRAIDFTGFSGVANGKFSGTQYVTSVEAGLPIKLDGWAPRTVLTPVGKLGYTTLRQDGYTETGGNGAALKVDGVHYSSLKSELGAKLERAFTTSYGELSPAVQLGWRHEFRANALQTVSSFASDASGATNFVSTGATPLRDTGVLALSATLARSQNLSLMARYTIEAARGYTAQTGDVRLRYQF